MVGRIRELVQLLWRDPSYFFGMLVLAIVAGFVYLIYVVITIPPAAEDCTRWEEIISPVENHVCFRFTGDDDGVVCFQENSVTIVECDSE